MGLRDQAVIVRRGAEVVALQDVVRRVVETALRHHHLRHGIRIVRVAVEKLVLLAYGGVAGGAVGLRQVRLAHHLVLLRRLHVAEGADGAQVEPLDRLVGQLQLELHVRHVQVDVVVPRLVQDIEGRVVHDVSLVRAHRAARVQGVAEGVDVEVARVFAAHGVRRAVQRAGRALVAHRAVHAHAQREPLADVVRRVHVGRVAAYLIGHAPSRVVQKAHRSVEAAAVGTRRDAHGVVALYRGAEQLLEPVGVPHLGLLQVSQAGGLGVHQLAPVY